MQIFRGTLNVIIDVKIVSLWVKIKKKKYINCQNAIISECHERFRQYCNRTLAELESPENITVEAVSWTC
jgi:hypothetical protein